MNLDAFEQIPMWKHREEMRGAKFSYFIFGAFIGAVMVYWLR